MQKALKALLVADEPLGASDIIERAGISERSYTRNIDELAAVGMVEATGNGGHKQWQAWLIPWWSPLAGVDAPRTAETDGSPLTPPSRWDGILYEIVCTLDCTHDDELFTQPIDIDEVFATLPRLDRWRGFFEAHYGRGGASATADSSDDRQSTDRSIHTDHTVEVGVHPAGRADQQRSLDGG